MTDAREMCPHGYAYWQNACLVCTTDPEDAPDVMTPEMSDLDARIDALHGPGAAAALDRAIADGSVFSDSARPPDVPLSDTYGHSDADGPSW